MPKKVIRRSTTFVNAQMTVDLLILSIILRFSGGVENAMSVTFKDTGMGMAEGNVDDLFDPFRRGNLALASDIPGSGLGLAIVREVVEQAYGRIEVKTAVGRGSEFTLFLPLKQGETATHPTARDTRAASLRTPGERRANE